ncbi:MAG: diacylglycerol kinase family protein, partial [Myxococcota bacterium]
PSFSIIFTQYPRDATALAYKAAKNKEELIVSVGGDGTLNEIVNGLMFFQEDHPKHTLPEIGILPQGTGGDFRRTLFPHHKPIAYIQSLCHAQAQTIDVGKATCILDGKPYTRYFVNVLSVGLGGLVDQIIHQFTHMEGKRAYFMAALQALGKNILAPLHVELSHPCQNHRTIDLSSRNLSICNGSYFGGGMHIAPQASLQDGLFHVVNFSTPYRLQLFTLSKALYQGEHLQRQDVQCFEASHIKVAARSSLLTQRAPLDIDGEAVGLLPLEAFIVPNALSLRFPTAIEETSALFVQTPPEP